MVEIITQWPKICTSGAVWFLSAIEDNLIGTSEWPYMHKVDPDATSAFFGLAQAMSFTGHAIAAMIFAFWSYKWQTTKWPLLTGRLISLIGCILYLGVEILNTNRRFLMMACYFLFGAGFGSMSVLRTYVAECSSERDRSKAYSITTAANLLAISLGPLIQLIFSSKTFDYPGHDIIKDKVRFNFYTAPIWFALGMNLIAILLLIFLFKDIHANQRTTSKSLNLKEIWLRIRKSEIIWGLVFLCLLQTVASKITSTTISTITAPLLMAGYGWSGHTSVIVMSIGQSVVGIICVIVAALFIFCHLGQRIHPRITFLFGMSITVLFYVITYPWPGINVSPPIYNETTDLGCDPSLYGWCDGHSASPYLWIPFLILVMGLGLPIFSISLDTIYSKVLGNIDQNTMQGIEVLVEDVTKIVGSIYSAAIFSRSGQKYLWIVNGSITLIALIAWMIGFKRLTPFR